MSKTLSPGISGIQLDLFVKAGPVLFDPSPYPTYSISDSNSAFQGSGTGFRIGIGHFDARNFLVSSSGAVGTWTITWTVGSTTKIEQFTVTAPTLSVDGNLVNSLDQIISNIRIDIGDFDGSVFPVSLLERYLEKAVMRLNRELGIAEGKVRPTGITPGGLGTPARIPGISLDMYARSIFPDNDEIKDLIVLQAEVLITDAEMSALRRASSTTAGAAGAELITATSGIVNDVADGVMIRNADGVTIDTRQRYSTWAAEKTKLFLAESKARKEQLEKAIKNLRYSFSSNMSKVVY